MFYTYAHYRKDTNTVFYIGKGTGNRLMTTKSRNKWWQAIANKHGWRAEIIAEWPTEAEAFEHEKFLIKCFRDMGVVLTNQTDGGEGFTGGRHTAESREAIGAAFRGTSRSAEYGAKVSAAKTGMPCAEETKRKISKTKTGSKDSAETRAKKSVANKVAQNRPEVLAANSDRGRLHMASMP